MYILIHIIQYIAFVDFSGEKISTNLCVHHAFTQSRVEPPLVFPITVQYKSEQYLFAFIFRLSFPLIYCPLIIKNCCCTIIADFLSIIILSVRLSVCWFLCLICLLCLFVRFLIFKLLCSHGQFFLARCGDGLSTIAVIIHTNIFNREFYIFVIMQNKICMVDNGLQV